MSEPAITILLVEDNPDHAELTLRALKRGRMLNRIEWVKDGAEALDLLYRRGAYTSQDVPRPGLVLLDMKLPKVDGHEVLRQIKGDPALKSIPVVMLTTSDRSDDVDLCYQAGANSFVTKPVSFQEFVKTIESVEMYWVLTNRRSEA
jgi:CheY-like chemotaxis protein